MPTTTIAPAVDEPSSAAAVSSAGVADAAVIFEARRVRRHLRTLWRLFKVAMVAGVVSTCGLATQNLTTFGCRSKQSEAKGNLKALYVAEQALLFEEDVFSDDPARIGFAPKGSRLRYRYVITDVGGVGDDATFRGWAFADPSVDGTVADDVWRIDKSGHLEHLVNGCAR